MHRLYALKRHFLRDQHVLARIGLGLRPSRSACRELIHLDDRKRLQSTLMSGTAANYKAVPLIVRRLLGGL